MTRARFALFMMNEIFPGGRLPTVAIVEDHATKAGFEVARVQPLRLHYARTLDFWAEALEARKDEAIAIQSEEVYERYMKYLTGCANLFREGSLRRGPVHPGQAGRISPQPLELSRRTYCGGRPAADTASAGWSRAPGRSARR